MTANLDPVQLRKRDEMRREALELVDDAADLAESRTVRTYMEYLRGDLHRLRTQRGELG